MAKLRVEDTVGGGPSEDGYVAVVENLIFGESDIKGEDMYRDFLDAEPDERVGILKEAAAEYDKKTGEKIRDFFVTHLIVEGGKGKGMLKDFPEEIQEDNCRIFVERDRRKKRRVHKSRFTVALPQDRPKGNVDYLQPYAEIIYGLYRRAAAAASATPPDVQEAAELRSKAHKFMFGMMLLTRCR